MSKTDFKNKCSGYLGKMGQVSLVVGNPYWGDFWKKVTVRLWDRGKGFMFSSNPFPLFSH
jgi:hypothetical protein